MRFGWGIELDHAFDLHIAVLELPLIVLLEEDRVSVHRVGGESGVGEVAIGMCG